MVKFNESDLYPPVKKFFAESGYEVRGEVKNCDVTLVKDGELVIIELKKSFNMTLLYQAVDRLKITSQVYVCIPRPAKTRRNDGDYRNMLHIVRKLGLGLITVAMDAPERNVDIITFPEQPSKERLTAKGARRKASIVSEISQRTMDLNTGGTLRQKIATAYREKSVKIACVLERSGNMSAKDMRNLYGCAPNTYYILRENHYGWFEKCGDAFGKGQYGLSEEGMRMLDGNLFPEIIDYYRKNL